jgi:hypothetical protein
MLCHCNLLKTQMCNLLFRAVPMIFTSFTLEQWAIHFQGNGIVAGNFCCSGCVYDSLSCVSSIYFINYFMTHRSCDYGVTLKHTETENSDGEVIILGSVLNYDFLHTSIRNWHDAHLISELLNWCIAYCFLRRQYYPHDISPNAWKIMRDSFIANFTVQGWGLW